jgi:hypothetical protein
MWAFSGAISPAGASGWDVCAHGCRYDQVGPALAAAGDGDTIRVGPGTYMGGLTITTSLTLVGSGRDATIIRGGGPVITIGTFGAATEPTVTIRGMTLTGGVSRTSPVSIPFLGQAGAWASGGGVEIPPGLDSGARFGPGASVIITDSAVTENRVAPSAAVPLGPPCPTGPCPAAVAAGGGIDSWGDLTLVRTSVSHNRVGTASGLSDLASDAVGGGIQHSAGDLTISDSSLQDNQVSTNAPNGRFAEGGALNAQGRTVTLSHDIFRGNGATLHAGLPDSVGDMVAQAGAVLLSTQVATIRDTEFANNSATMTNTAGNTYANSGAVHGNLLLTLSGGVFRHNSVVSATLPGSTGRALGDSGAGEVSGTITGTRFTHNTLTVSSAAGAATASGGAAILSGSLTDSVVSSNRVIAHSRQGTVTLAGAGIQAGDFDLTLQDTDVTGNRGVAIGSSGAAHGGGISDSPVPEGPPGGPLSLTGSHITGNKLTASPNITVNGGGVYSTYPVVLTDTVIARNSPDQCIGC